LPPAIVLGGDSNALSVARSLGRQGIPVYAIGYDPHLRFSRYCRWIHVPFHHSDEATWSDYLLGPESDGLRGSVLLACSDGALATIARHREVLAEKFLLDESHVPAQLCMLNKLSTYRAAVEAGVPAPRFWEIGCAADLQRHRADLVFPLLVKPLFSHHFGSIGGKFLVARSFDELTAAYARTQDARIEVLLLELIPGPDSRLCSYYTYLDAEGRPRFDFTKRIIRRFPVNMGNACYHITDRVPEVRELSLQLLQHVGLRGLACVEFKRDPRDDRLKLIECNARFTAANNLVAAAGFDLARFVYNRRVGLSPPPMEHYACGMRLWYPREDFRSFRVLHERGELSWWGWLRSIAHRQRLPFFSWSDPLPSLGTAALESKWLTALGRPLFRLAQTVRRLLGKA
jgi:predicted ATP-grasp superfamily ATP-dependent carboligase